MCGPVFGERRYNRKRTISCMFLMLSVRLWRKGACHIPFFTLCITTLGSFAALFIAAKLIGHKQIAQLDFFDYITGITIGSIAAEMATELEKPWKPLIAILIYGGSHFCSASLPTNSPGPADISMGHPPFSWTRGSSIGKI